jgi:hypothetical protein
MTILRIPTFVALIVFGGLLAQSEAQDIFKRSTDKNSSAETADKKAADADAADKSETKASDSVAKSSSASGKATDAGARINKGSDGWYSIAGSAANADFRMPGKPEYKERSFSPIAGRPAVTNHMYQFHKPNGELSVIVAWLDLHEEPAGRVQRNNVLAGAVSGAVANVLGQLERNDGVKTGNHSGREFDFTFIFGDKNYSSRSRVFLAGKRQYRIDVISLKGKEDPELVTKLFDSFLIK